MSEEVVLHDEYVPEEVGVACLAWNYVRDGKCRHFDHVCLVSLVDGNGNTVLNLDRRFCDLKTLRSKIKIAIRGKILVGYNLGKFLRLINLDHPLHLSRNLVYFGPFVKKFWNQKSRPSLEEIAQEMLRVTMRGKMLPGSVKSAEIVLDLWNLMQMYESSRRSEKVLSARFLIHATKDVLGLLFRRVNLIRKAGHGPTGIQVTRLTEDHFERIIGINFTSIDDLGKVVDLLIRELGINSPTVRLLVHKNMIKPVESRRSVLSSLYQTSITVFPSPAPGSAEHVVLLQGTRAGLVKTLEMIMKMSIQLEKDNTNQFYTFHKDFYDAANADPVTTEEYGGFGRRILQPTLPPVKPVNSTISLSKSLKKSPMKSQPIKLPHSLTPSLSFECVKAKLSLKPELTPTSNNPCSQDMAISSATDYNNVVVNVAPGYNISLASPPDQHKSVATPAHNNQSLATPAADHNKSPAIPPDHNKSPATSPDHNKYPAIPPDHNKSRAIPPDHKTSRAIPPDHNTSQATPPGYSRSPATALEYKIPVATPPDQNISLARDQYGQHFTKTEWKFLAKGEEDWTLMASPVVIKSPHAATSSQKTFRQHSIANETAHGENEGPATEPGDETSVEMTVSRALVDLVNLHMATLNSFGAFLEIGEMNTDMEVVVKISGTKNQVRQAYRHVQQLVEGAGLSSADA